MGRTTPEHWELADRVIDTTADLRAAIKLGYTPRRAGHRGSHIESGTVPDLALVAGRIARAEVLLAEWRDHIQKAEAERDPTERAAFLGAAAEAALDASRLVAGAKISTDDFAATATIPAARPGNEPEELQPAN